MTNITIMVFHFKMMTKNSIKSTYNYKLLSNVKKLSCEEKYNIYMKID